MLLPRATGANQRLPYSPSSRPGCLPAPVGPDAATRAHVERRTKEGKSKAEIIRCLKRYAARQACPYLRPAAS